MQYIQLIKLVLSLLPLILEVVKAVEKALPEGTAGNVKLALVRGSVESAYSVAEDAVGTFEKVWPAIEKTVASVVSVYNTVGVFKK